MTIPEQIKEIKTQLRMAMNGAASQSMRESGLDYRLNFGVELPRLKTIAARFGKNHDLAQALWKEDIRETKILATLLQPVETFYPEIADIWAESIRFGELAELACMNLFQHLPYAPRKAFEWMARDEEHVQQCGFLLAARLLMKGCELNPQGTDELTDQALAAIASPSARLRRAAALALKKYAAQNNAQAQHVRQALRPLADDDDEYVRLVAGDILDDISTYDE